MVAGKRNVDDVNADPALFCPLHPLRHVDASGIFFPALCPPSWLKIFILDVTHLASSDALCSTEVPANMATTRFMASQDVLDTTAASARPVKTGYLLSPAFFLCVSYS